MLSILPISFGILYGYVASRTHQLAESFLITCLLWATTLTLITEISNALIGIDATIVFLAWLGVTLGILALFPVPSLVGAKFKGVHLTLAISKCTQ